MALETMKMKVSTLNTQPEILYYADYTGKALTLDTSAFTNGLCKAGTPINNVGKKAATTGEATKSSDALGILLVDVEQDRPLATVVVGGYIRTSVAQTHSGVTYDAETKAALKNVVFM